MKILIVDDSKVARNCIKKALSNLMDIKFFEADDGKTAWSLVVDDMPDLIFTDWYMENMDGVELIRKIRKMNKSVKICMLTSETNDERKAFARHEGADYILCKPIRAEQLAKALENLLG